MNSKQKQQLYNKLYRYLSYRERSIHEFREYVRKQQERFELTEDDIESIVQHFHEQKYLDDDRFTRMWIQNRTRVKRKGKYVIQRELQKKGIDKNSIHTALEKIDDDELYQNAKQVLAKKSKHWKALSYMKVLDEEVHSSRVTSKEKKQDFWKQKQKVKNKAYNLLTRYGYDYSITRRVIDEWFNEL